MHAVTIANISVDSLAIGIPSFPEHSVGQCQALTQVSRYLAEILGCRYHSDMARLYLGDTGRHNVYKVQYLTRSQINQLLLLLKRNADSEFRIIELDAHHVIFGNKICPNKAMTGNRPLCGPEPEPGHGDMGCRMTLLFN